MKMSFDELRKETLAEMKAQRDVLDQAIKRLEYDLAHPYIPLELTGSEGEIERQVAEWKERDIKRELEMFGRQLTEGERRGWVILPSLINKEGSNVNWEKLEDNNRRA